MAVRMDILALNGNLAASPAWVVLWVPTVHGIPWHLSPSLKQPRTAIVSVTVYEVNPQIRRQTS